MIFTVSTVKDSPNNLKRFVDMNLAAGVDHMFIFVEECDGVAGELLDSYSQITWFRADREYYSGEKPKNLNMRQTANANLINCALAIAEIDCWLFHIDGDECLNIDKGKLLGAEGDYVLLKPLEYLVSAHGFGFSFFKSKKFKRLLSESELALLYTLGIIDEPKNNAFFHGHTKGKSGVRPGINIKIGIHRHRSDSILKPVVINNAHVLHYDCVSFEDFKRKWKSHSGSQAKYRERRSLIKSAAYSVFNNSVLSQREKNKILRDIFEKYICENDKFLTKLGILVKPKLYSCNDAGYKSDTVLAGSALSSILNILLKHDDKLDFCRNPKDSSRGFLDRRRDLLMRLLEESGVSTDLGLEQFQASPKELILLDGALA